MTRNKTAAIPAVIVIIASLILIAYSFYAMSHSSHPAPPGGGGAMPPRGGRKEELEPFKLMGTIAVICGAVSFSWLRFKKKLTSSSIPVKKLGKLLYNVHKFVGWTALALVVVHGVYYLITKLQDDKIYTGLASFLILLALAGYGWMIKKARNPLMRKVHLFLSIVWIPALLLHAGGTMIMTVAVTIAAWILVWLLERFTRSGAANPKGI